MELECECYNLAVATVAGTLSPGRIILQVIFSCHCAAIRRICMEIISASIFIPLLLCGYRLIAIQTHTTEVCFWDH